MNRAVEILRGFELLEASAVANGFTFSTSAVCSAFDSVLKFLANETFCFNCSMVVMPTTCDATGWLSAYR